MPSTSEDLAAAMAAHQGGDLIGAEALYRQVIRRAPDNAEALHLLGVIHYQRQQHDEAIRLIRKAIGRNPRKAEYHTNLSLSLRDSEQFEEALEAAKKAVALKPDFAEAHANHGLVLMALRRPEDAIESLKRAIALKPNVAGFHNNLGNAYRGGEKYAEAEAAYRRALEMRPDHVHAMYGLSYALDEQDQTDAALAILESLSRIDPMFAEAHVRMGVILSRQGLVREAIDSLNKAMVADPEDIRPRYGRVFMSNFLDDVTAHDMLQVASAFAGKLAERTRQSPHANVVDPDRVLRLGFVSPDLHDRHPVGAFSRGVLEALDRTRFQLYCYNTWRKRDFEPLFDVWRDVEGLASETMASLIRSDGIDILIDLAGYTDNSRPDTFAEKPAPVQAIWLGYSGTTGSPVVDHIIADRWVIPEDEEGHYTERPLRLPDSYLCWTPPKVRVSVAPLPAVQSGFVTFGSFNNIRKTSDATARTWAHVLKAVPNSRIILKHGTTPDPKVVERIRWTLDQEGIGADRVEFLGRMPDKVDHLAAYGRIDIGLDPFPYNGTTTTMESLWMGVPVLTLAGDRFIAHVGESIAHTVGLADWISADADDYVMKAVEFASDISALAELRAGLRDRLIASPLCDAPRFARYFEQVLRAAWIEWCEKQPVRETL